MMEPAEYAAYRSQFTDSSNIWNQTVMNTLTDLIYRQLKSD